MILVDSNIPMYLVGPRTRISWTRNVCWSRRCRAVNA